MNNPSEDQSSESFTKHKTFHYHHHKFSENFQFKFYARLF